MRPPHLLLCSGIMVNGRDRGLRDLAHLQVIFVFLSHHIESSTSCDNLLISYFKNVTAKMSIGTWIDRYFPLLHLNLLAAIQHSWKFNDCCNVPIP